MNDNQQIEVHYVNTGFPYTVTDSFMDLFEGLDYVHPDLALAEALQDQESVYWSLQAYSEKQGTAGSASSNSHNGHGQTYEGNEHEINTTDSTRDWNNNSQVNNDQAIALVLQETEGSEDITNMMATASIEECNRGHRAGSSSSQSTLQDIIDPDNMTYEELVELGEAVGSHSRGLCSELIASLPVSKYKAKLFSRRKNRDDLCVICHMDYKRGDRMITLPCKHPYHEGCITRWLHINKACPVCYVEVFG